jgi:hypothetical protein
MTLNNSPEAVHPEIATKDTESAQPKGCCGGPAPADSSACCVLDAEVKAEGGTGCGCGPKVETTPRSCCS